MAKNKNKLTVKYDDAEERIDSEEESSNESIEVDNAEIKKSEEVPNILEEELKKVKERLKKVEKITEVIKLSNYRDLEEVIEGVKGFVKEAEEALKRVHNEFEKNSPKLKEIIEERKEKIKGMRGVVEKGEKIIEEAKKGIEEVIEIIKGMRGVVQEGEKKIKKSKEIIEEAEEALKGMRGVVEKAEKALKEVKEVIEKAEKDITELASRYAIINNDLSKSEEYVATEIKGSIVDGVIVENNDQLIDRREEGKIEEIINAEGENSNERINADTEIKPNAEIVKEHNNQSGGESRCKSFAKRKSREAISKEVIKKNPYVRPSSANLYRSNTEEKNDLKSSILEKNGGGHGFIAEKDAEFNHDNNSRFPSDIKEEGKDKGRKTSHEHDASNELVANSVATDSIDGFRSSVFEKNKEDFKKLKEIIGKKEEGIEVNESSEQANLTQDYNPNNNFTENLYMREKNNTDGLVEAPKDASSENAAENAKTEIDLNADNANVENNEQSEAESEEDENKSEIKSNAKIVERRNNQLEDGSKKGEKLNESSNAADDNEEKFENGDNKGEKVEGEQRDQNPIENDAESEDQSRDGRGKEKAEEDSSDILKAELKKVKEGLEKSKEDIEEVEKIIKKAREKFEENPPKLKEDIEEVEEIIKEVREKFGENSSKLKEDIEKVEEIIKEAKEAANKEDVEPEIEYIAENVSVERRGQFGGERGGEEVKEGSNERIHANDFDINRIANDTPERAKPFDVSIFKERESSEVIQQKYQLIEARSIISEKSVDEHESVIEEDAGSNDDKNSRSSVVIEEEKKYIDEEDFKKLKEIIGKKEEGIEVNESSEQANLTQDYNPNNNFTENLYMREKNNTDGLVEAPKDASSANAAENAKTEIDLNADNANVENNGHSEAKSEKDEKLNEGSNAADNIEEKVEEVDNDKKDENEEKGGENEEKVEELDEESKKVDSKQDNKGHQNGNVNVEGYDVEDRSSAKNANVENNGHSEAKSEKDEKLNEGSNAADNIEEKVEEVESNKKDGESEKKVEVVDNKGEQGNGEQGNQEYQDKNLDAEKGDFDINRIANDDAERKGQSRGENEFSNAADNIEEKVEEFEENLSEKKVEEDLSEKKNDKKEEKNKEMNYEEGLNEKTNNERSKKGTEVNAKSKASKIVKVSDKAKERGAILKSVKEPNKKSEYAQIYNNTLDMMRRAPMTAPISSITNNYSNDSEGAVYRREDCLFPEDVKSIKIQFDEKITEFFNIDEQVALDRSTKEKALREAEEALNKEEEALNQLNASIEVAKSDIKTAESDIETAKSDIETAKSDIEKAEKDRNESKDELKQLKESLERAKQGIAQLKELSLEKEKESVESKEELLELQEGYAKLKAELKTGCDELKKACNELKEKLLEKKALLSEEGLKKVQESLKKALLSEEDLEKAQESLKKALLSEEDLEKVQESLKKALLSEEDLEKVQESLKKLTESLSKKERDIENSKEFLAKERKSIEQFRKVPGDLRKIIEIAEEWNAKVSDIVRISEAAQIAKEWEKFLHWSSEKGLEKVEEFANEMEEILKEPKEVLEKLKEVFEKSEEVFEKSEEKIEKSEEIIEKPEKVLKEAEQFFEEVRKEFEESFWKSKEALSKLKKDRNELKEDIKRAEKALERAKKATEEAEKGPEEAEKGPERAEKAPEGEREAHERKSEEELQMLKNALANKGSIKKLKKAFNESKLALEKVEEILKEPKEVLEKLKEVFEKSEEKIEKSEEKIEKSEEKIEKSEEKIEKLKKDIEKLEKDIEKLKEGRREMSEALVESPSKDPATLKEEKMKELLALIPSLDEKRSPNKNESVGANDSSSEEVSSTSKSLTDIFAPTVNKMKEHMACFDKELSKIRYSLEEGIKKTKEKIERIELRIEEINRRLAEKLDDSNLNHEVALLQKNLLESYLTSLRGDVGLLEDYANRASQEARDVFIQAVNNTIDHIVSPVEETSKDDFFNSEMNMAQSVFESRHYSIELRKEEILAKQKHSDQQVAKAGKIIGIINNIKNPMINIENQVNAVHKALVEDNSRTIKQLDDVMNKLSGANLLISRENIKKLIEEKIKINTYNKEYIIYINKIKEDYISSIASDIDMEKKNNQSLIDAAKKGIIYSNNTDTIDIRDGNITEAIRQINTHNETIEFEDLAKSANVAILKMNNSKTRDSEEIIYVITAVSSVLKALEVKKEEIEVKKRGYIRDMKACMMRDIKKISDRKASLGERIDSLLGGMKDSMIADAIDPVAQALIDEANKAATEEIDNIINQGLGDLYLEYTDDLPQVSSDVFGKGSVHFKELANKSIRRISDIDISSLNSGIIGSDKDIRKLDKAEDRVLVEGHTKLIKAVASLENTSDLVATANEKYSKIVEKIPETIRTATERLLAESKDIIDEKIQKTVEESLKDSLKITRSILEEETMKVINDYSNDFTQRSNEFKELLNANEFLITCLEFNLTRTNGGYLLHAEQIAENITKEVADFESLYFADNDNKLIDYFEGFNSGKVESECIDKIESQSTVIQEVIIEADKACREITLEMKKYIDDFFSELVDKVTEGKEKDVFKLINQKLMNKASMLLSDKICKPIHTALRDKSSFTGITLDKEVEKKRVEEICTNFREKYSSILELLTNTKKTLCDTITQATKSIESEKEKVLERLKSMTDDFNTRGITIDAELIGGVKGRLIKYYEDKMTIINNEISDSISEEIVTPAADPDTLIGNTVDALRNKYFSERAIKERNEEITEFLKKEVNKSAIKELETLQEKKLLAEINVALKLLGISEETDLYNAIASLYAYEKRDHVSKGLRSEIATKLLTDEHLISFLILSDVALIMDIFKYLPFELKGSIAKTLLTMGDEEKFSLDTISELLLYLSQKDEEEFKEANEDLVRSLQASDLWHYKIGDLKGYKEADKLFADIISNTEKSKLPEIVIDTLNKLKNDADKKPNSIRESLLNDQGANVIQKVCEKLVVSIISSSTLENQKLYFNLLKEITKELPPKTAKNILNSRKMNKIAKENYKKDLLKAIQDWISIEKMGELDKFKKIEDIAASLKIFIDLDLGEPVDPRLGYISNCLNDICVSLKLPDFNDFESMEGFNREKYIDKANKLINSDILDFLAECRKCYANYAISKTSFDPKVSNAVQQWLEELTGAIKDLQTPSKKEKDKVKSKADINNELFKEWGAILGIDDSMEVYRTEVDNSDQDNFKIVALAFSPERFKDSEMLLNMLHNGSKSTTVAVAPVPHAVAAVPQRRAIKTMASDIKLQNKLGKPTMTQKLRRELYGKFAEKALGNEDLLSKFKPEDRCTYIMNFFRWIPEISKPRFAKDILIKYGFEKFSDEDKLKLISCLDRKYVEEKKLNPRNKMVEEAQILISDLCDPGSKTIEASIDSLKKKKSELIYAAALQCKDQENVQEVLKQLISYITLSRDENNKQEGFKILKSFVKGLPRDAVVDALNHKSITELDGDKKLLDDIVKWATIEKDENKFTETAEKIFSIIERLNAIIVPQDEYHKVDDSLKNIHCLLESLKDDIGNRFTLDKFEDIKDLRNNKYNKLLFASLDEKVLRDIKKCKEAYDYTALSGSNTYKAFIRDDAKSLFEELIGAVEYVRRKAREEEGVEKEFDQMQGELKLEMISIMNHIKDKSAYAPQHQEYHIDADSGMDFASLIFKLFDGKGLNDAIKKYYNLKSDKDKKIFNELCLSRQLLEKFALKMLKNKAFVHEALNKGIMGSDNIMRMFGFIPYDLKRSIAGGLLELKSVKFSSELLTELMRSVDIEEEKRFRQKNKIRVIRAERDIYKKSHKDLGKMIKCSFDDDRSMAELFDLLAYGDDEHSAISINALESFSPDELRSFISVNLREEKDAKIMKAAFKRLFVYMLDPSLSESDDIMKCDRVLEEMVRVLPRHTVLEVINDKRIDEAIKNYGRDGLEADIKVRIADISNWIIRFLASIVVGFVKPKFVGDKLYKEKKALDSRRDSSLQRLKNMRTIMPIRKEFFDTFYQMNDLLIELAGLIRARTASDSPTVKADTDILSMRSLFDIPSLFDPEWFAKNIADDKYRASELEKYKLLSDAIRDGAIMDRIQSCKDIYRKIGSRNGEGNDCNTFLDNRIKNCLAELLDIGENAQSKLQKEEMTKFKLKAKDEDQLLSDAKEIFDRLRSPMKSLTDAEEGVMNDLSSKYEESVRNISNIKGILKNKYHVAYSAREIISSLDSIINSRLKGKSSYKKELDEYFEGKLKLLKSNGNSFKTLDELSSHLAKQSEDPLLSKHAKEEIEKEILLLNLDKAEKKENDLLRRLVPLKLKIEANLGIKGIADLRRCFSDATNHLLNQRLKQLREKDRPTASDCKEINLIELRKELLGELAADVLTNKDLISLIAPDRNDLTTVTDMIPFISGSRIKSVADFLIKRYGHIQELYLLGPYLDNKDLQKFTKVEEAFARTQGKKDIKFEELKKYANNPANFAEFTRFYDDEAICKVIASKLNSAEGAKSIEVFIRYMYSRSPADIMYAGWDRAKESDFRDYQEKMATLFKRFSSVLELFPEKTCLAALKSIEMSQKNGDAARKTERLTDDQKSSISEWIKAKKRGLDERSKKISAIIKELNMRISLRSDYDRDIENSPAVMLYNALDKFDKDVVSPTILEDYNRVASFNRLGYDSSLKLIRDVNNINNIKRLYEEYRKNMKLDDSENSRSNDALDKDADILFAKLVHSVRSIESSAEQKLTKEDKKKERESERLLKEANAIFDDLNALSKNYKSIHGADLENCPYITSCYSLSEVIENLLNNDKLELLDGRLKELRAKEGSLTPKEVDELNILSSRKELLGICATSILKSEDLNFDANDKNISIFHMIGFVPEHLKESVVKALYKRNNPLIKKGMKEVNDYLNQICDRKKSLDACKIHIDVYIDFAISELTKDKKEKLFEKLLEKMNSKLIRGCSGEGDSDSVFNALIKKLPLDYLLKMSQKDDTLLYPNIKGSRNYIMNDPEKKKDMKERMVNGKMSYQIEAIIKELRILIASNRDYERHPMLIEVGRGLKEINDELINQQRLGYGYIDKSYLYTLHNSIPELANRYAIAAIRINDGLSKDRAKDLFASLKDAVNDLSEIKYKASDTMSELEKAPANNSLEELAESMHKKTRSTIEGGGGRDLSDKALNAHSDDGSNDDKSNDDNCNRKNGATFANKELIEALPKERYASMIEEFVPKEVDNIPENLSESKLDTKSPIGLKSIISEIEEDDEEQSESIKDTSNDRSKKDEKKNGGGLSIITEEEHADYYTSMILPQDQEIKFDNSITSESKLSKNDNEKSKVIKNDASASHAPIDNGPVVNPVAGPVANPVAGHVVNSVAADSRVAFRFTKALESALGAQGLNIFGLDNNRNTNNSFKSAAYAILSCAAVWRYNPTMQYRIIPALISNFVIEFFNLWAQKWAQKGWSKTAALLVAAPVAALICSIVWFSMPLVAGIILIPMISQLLTHLADLIDRYYNKNEYGRLASFLSSLLSTILKMLSMIVSVVSLQLISDIGRDLIPSLLPGVLKNWLQEISIVLIFVPAVYSILKGNTWKSLILTTLKIVALIGVILFATYCLGLSGMLAYIPTAISVISNIRINDKKDFQNLVIAGLIVPVISWALVSSLALSIPMAVMASVAIASKALERITNCREMGGENKGKYSSLFVLDIITTAMSMYISSYFAKLATHNIVGGSMSGGYVERDMAEYNSGFKLPVKSGAYQKSHADIIPSVFNALSISRGTKNDFFKALSSSGGKPLPIASIAPNDQMMIIAALQCLFSSIEAYISKKLANDKKPAPTQVPQ